MGDCAGVPTAVKKGNPAWVVGPIEFAAHDDGAVDGGRITTVPNFVPRTEPDGVALSVETTAEALMFTR